MDCFAVSRLAALYYPCPSYLSVYKKCIHSNGFSPDLLISSTPDKLNIPHHPPYFVLFKGESLNTLLNLSSLIASHSSVDKFRISGIGRKDGSSVGVLNRFQGQISWQISQTKSPVIEPSFHFRRDQFIF